MKRKSMSAAFYKKYGRYMNEKQKIFLAGKAAGVGNSRSLFCFIHTSYRYKIPRMVNRVKWHYFL